MEELKFPQEEDLMNYTRNTKPAEIQIPPGLLQERLSRQNNDEGDKCYVVILIQSCLVSTVVDDLMHALR